MKTQQQKDSELFLRALYGNKDPSHWGYIWTATQVPKGQESKKKTHWFQTAAQAIKIVDDLNALPIAERPHIYASMGLVAKRGSPYGRHKEHETVALCAIVVDFDLSGEAHDGRALPTTMKQIDEFIANPALMPFKFTMITGSGNGRHTWLVFKEPFAIEDKEDFDKIKDTFRGFNGYVNKQALRAGGWRVDAIHDLSRVMRVPGTLNVKTDPPVMAEMLQFRDDCRPDPEVIYDWLDEMPAEAFDYGKIGTSKNDYSGVMSKEMQDKTFLIDGNANADPDALDAMLANNDQFKGSWNRERDKKLDSPSKYHYSMGYHAKVAGWTDQEIVDCIIQWQRNKFGPGSPQHEKIINRRDLLARILVKMDQKMAIDGINEEDLVDEAPDETMEAMETGDKKKMLAHLRVQLGVPICGVHQFRREDLDGEDSIWEIEVQDGRRVLIGKVENIILSKMPISAAMANAVGMTITRSFKPSVWATLADLIVKCADKHESGIASMSDDVFRILTEHVALHVNESIDADYVSCLRDDQVFIWKDCIYIPKTPFARAFKQNNTNALMSMKDVEKIMTGAKLTIKRVGPRVPGDKKKKLVQSSCYVGKLEELPEVLAESFGQFEQVKSKGI